MYAINVQQDRIDCLLENFNKAISLVQTKSSGIC